MKKLLGIVIVFIILLGSNSFSFAALGYNNNTDPECGESNPMCRNGKLAYPEITKHDLPFDPHGILNEWKPILNAPIPPQSWAIIMGNPKVNWEEVPDGLDPSLAIKPEGEKYTAIIFVFVLIPGTPDRMSNATAMLVMIRYRCPNLGRDHVHILTPNKKEYKHIPKEKELEIRERLMTTPNACSRNTGSASNANLLI